MADEQSGNAKPEAPKKVTYDSLSGKDRVAVKMNAVEERRDGENVTIKPEQTVAWTKAHYEALKKANPERFEKAKNGEVYLPELDRRIKLLGVPTFEEQDSEAGGTVEVLTGYTPFADK